jgi:hypothetical protein
MAFFGIAFGKVSSRGKSARRNRGVPSRGRLTRLAVEPLEPRMLLSASATDNATALASVSSAVTANALTAPAAPWLTVTALSSTQIKLLWGGVSGANGYLVNEKINNAWEEIGSFGSGVTSDTVTGLSPSTTYYFEVGASHSAGTSWSNAKSATTLKVMRPAAPSLTATAESSTEIYLSWNAVSGASGYVVNEWINGIWQRIGNFGSGVTSDTVTGLSPDTTYYFEVGASDSAGTTWSSAKVATTLKLEPPAAPSLGVTAVSSTQINVWWNTVSGASGYLLDDKINGAWKPIGSFGSGVTTDTVTGLSPGTTYYFEVGASNAAGTSWSNAKSALTFPAAPSFTLTAESNTEIYLS